jgi:ABC-type branched-subunit amino acid transport system substrate-binding protein
MILVQNHLRQLSGNKIGYLIFICSCLAACSPKVGTNKLPQTTIEKKAEQPIAQPDKKFTEANIALLIPFKLNKARIATMSKAEAEKSAMAIDFYQGFTMGIDSAASSGMNFHVNVQDTRDNSTQITSLIRSGQLSLSHLIVGPVFPDGIKFMSNYSIANNIPVVSPLAATNPEEFNNPNLISVVNNIYLHAAKMGDYVIKTYDPAKTVVVLISTKKPDDELLGAPLRTYFLQGKGNRFAFEEYSSVFTMEMKMVPGKQYLVMVASADKQFVIPTIDKLAKMKSNGSKLELFGHPNWIKQDYNTDKLQALRTKVTSSYTVDYKSQAVISFVRKYRAAYHFEPGEYAFKGFDIGFYFGKMLAEHGAGFVKHLKHEKYKGLHNSFEFTKDDKAGYINTNLSLLVYKNYALNPIE